MPDLGQLKGFLYIHNAILGETSRLEERLFGLDPADEAKVNYLRSDFEFLVTVCREHEASEEKIFFPAADTKLPYLAAPYVRDHREHDAIEERLLSALDSVGGGTSAEERESALQKAYREGVAFNAVMSLHVTKENELVLPALEREFSDEELAAMNERLPEVMAPDLMQQMTPWMFRWQDLEGKVGMTQELMRIVPAEVAPQLVGLLAQEASAEVWAEVVKRVPDLPEEVRSRST